MRSACWSSGSWLRLVVIIRVVGNVRERDDHAGRGGCQSELIKSCCPRPSRRLTASPLGQTSPQCGRTGGTIQDHEQVAAANTSNCSKITSRLDHPVHGYSPASRGVMRALSIFGRPTTWAISSATQDSASTDIPSPCQGRASGDVHRAATSASTTHGSTSARCQHAPTGLSAISHATTASSLPCRS